MSRVPASQVLRIFYLAAVPFALSAADGGAIEGTVIDSVTGRGIPGVHVEMAGEEARTLKFRMETGPSGEFRFTDVSPGQHSFVYEKDGFDLTDFSGYPDTVWVTSQATGHVLQKLDPLTTIEGKVLDGENHGVKRITVELLTGRGEIRVTVATDAAGAFQVRNLHPGVYLLRATPNRPAGSGNMAADLTSTAMEASLQNRTLRAPAYYPGVPSLAEASPIRVNGESELQGYDIRLRTSGTYAIRGRVLDPGGHPVPKATVKLKSADAYYMFDEGPADAEISCAADGRFEFPSATPGNWHVLAEFEPAPHTPRLMAFVPVALGHSDREGLNVPLAEPFALDVSVEGLPVEDAKRRGPALHLIPVDGPLEQEVQTDGPWNGRILADRVYPGRYRLSLSPRPGYYLASILYGDRDVLGQDVELMDAGRPIRIVYKQNGGRVRGTVEDAAGATVVLLPEESSADYWQSARIDSQGRFEIADLRPGNYFAIAVQRSAALQDPGFVTLAGKQGKVVNVSAGEITAADLRLTAWPR